MESGDLSFYPPIFAERFLIFSHVSFAILGVLVFSLFKLGYLVNFCYSNATQGTEPSRPRYCSIEARLG